MRDERDQDAIIVALSLAGTTAVINFVSGFAIGVSAILIFVIVVLSLFWVPTAAFLDRR